MTRRRYIPPGSIGELRAPNRLKVPVGEQGHLTPIRPTFGSATAARMPTNITNKIHVRPSMIVIYRDRVGSANYNSVRVAATF